MEESTLVTPKRPRFQVKELISLSVILFLIIAIATGVYLSLRPQTLINQAAPKTNIEIISPSPNDSIKGLMVVKASSQTPVDSSKLVAVIKVDGSNAEDMRVSKGEGNKVNLGTALVSSKYGNGQHTVDLFLYDTSGGTPTLIGNAKTDVQINN
jgi:hypothetical protein